MNLNEQWPEDRVGRLKVLWAAGKSAKQIADELQVSRNAVLAKVNRLREAGEDIASRDSPIKRPPPNEHPTMLELSPRACRYPLGGPKDKAVHFCGADTGSPERSYCAFHHSVAWTPAKTKWDGGQRRAAHG